MDWIKYPRSLINNPKTKRVSRKLGIPAVHIIGHLLSLWSWAVDFAPDGNLKHFTAEDIADAAGWEGDPDVFVEALISCGIRGGGFLDRVNDDELCIHDWDDHTGLQLREVEKLKKQNRERVRKHRQKDCNTDECNGNVIITSPLPDHYVTITDALGNGGVMPIDKIREDKIRGEESREDKQNKKDIISPQPAQRKSEAAQPAQSEIAGLADEELPMLDAEQRQAFGIIQRMYDLLPEYTPSPREEISAVWHMSQDYPEVKLPAEFRLALEWLKSKTPKKRSKYKNLRLFLQNWVKSARERQIKASPQENYFVPAESFPMEAAL